MLQGTRAIVAAAARAAHGSWRARSRRARSRPREDQDVRPAAGQYSPAADALCASRWPRSVSAHARGVKAVTNCDGDATATNLCLMTSAKGLGSSRWGLLA
jgi:hypothetical protein